MTAGQRAEDQPTTLVPVRTSTRKALQRFVALVLLPLLLVPAHRVGAAPAFDDPSGTSEPTPTAASPTGEPGSPPGSTVVPTVSQAASPQPTPTRSEWTPPPLSLMLTEPLPPFQGNHITGIYQEGCGDPSRALVFVQVANPDQIAAVRYEYHVGTTVPFDGVNNSPTMASGARLWRGMIGPFEADPRNADGGPITVTAYGLYRDGSERSVTETWTLRPCVR